MTCVNMRIRVKTEAAALIISLSLSNTPARVRSSSRAMIARSMIDLANRIPVGTTVSFLFARNAQRERDSSLGECDGTSKSNFNCTCSSDWTGDRCETKLDFCHNITCRNGGSCRPLVGNFTCDCPTEDYSGEFCENLSLKIKTLQFIARSFAFVVILSISSVAIFVIVMDVLKYFFNIDPSRKEFERLRRKKRHRLIAIRFLYVPHGALRFQ